MRNIDISDTAGSGASAPPPAPTSCTTAALLAPKSDEPRVIRLAILGAGVAGLTAALALSRLPLIPGVRLDIEVFDQARELREIGASIALQPCALRVLEKLGLGKEVEELAYRYGEHPLVHRHWRTGEIIPTDLPDPLPLEQHRLARFYRVALHKLLIRSLPPSIPIHLNKRVNSVSSLPFDDDGAHDTPDALETGPRPVRITFQDGSTWSGDAFVGADGIRSATRRSFYPEAEYAIKAGEMVTLRQVFPMNALDGMEGLDDIPKESCHWIGRDRQLFTSPLKNGLFSIVSFLPTHILSASSTSTSPPDPLDAARSSLSATPVPGQTWGHTAPTSLLSQFYSDWFPPIAALASRTPAIAIYPDCHGSALPSLAVGNGTGVLIGDAGHPHGGAFAAGGTMGIEDGYTLGLCLGHAFSCTHWTESDPGSGSSPASGAGAGVGVSVQARIRWAWDAFNKIRHGHVTRLIQAAEILRARRRADEGTLLEDEEIVRRVHARQNVGWLAENDTEGNAKRVMACMCRCGKLGDGDRTQGTSR